MRQFCANVVALLLPTTGALGQIPLSSTATRPVPRPTYGEKIRLEGLPNGGRISGYLYRGAQPGTAGLQQLRNLGVTTIVDLRGEDSARRDWERRQTESLGMRFVSIPVSGWAPPTDEQVAQFLTLFRNDRKEKIFVHCRFGDDRTGVFVATYRMAYEGWTAQQAINEMYFFGFNGIWHPSMKTFIREFPSRLKTVSAFAAYHPAPEPVTKCNDTGPAVGCSN